MTVDYEYITEYSRALEVAEEAKKCSCVSVDCETTGLDMFKLKPLLFQIEINDKAYVVDLRDISILPFKEILEDDKIVKLGANLKFDFKVIYKNYDIKIKNIFDVRVAEILLNAGRYGVEIPWENTGLGYLADFYCGVKLNKELAKSFIDFPDDTEFSKAQLEYAANDVLVLPQIRSIQQNYLSQYGLDFVANIEFNLIEPTAKMELNGIRIDAERWRECLKDVNAKLFQLSTELHHILPDPPAPEPKPIRLKKDGTPFKKDLERKEKSAPTLNLDSWQQLVWALNEIGISLEEANKITHKGLTNNTTLKVALNKFYKDDKPKSEIFNLLFKYRGLKQTEKTFGENLLAFIAEDGRIHAEFDSNGTDSGRFSVKNPNTDNIQKKGEEGRLLRTCIIPNNGNKFVIADLSQIELRVLAEISGDETMISVLSDSRGDIHRATASLAFNVPYDSVTKTQRDAAKTLNFGVIYGMLIKTLAERLSCSESEAEEIFNKYAAVYKKALEWLDYTGRKSFVDGYAKTMAGRVRWFPKLERNADYNRLKAHYERVGRNHVVQGTQADMIKLAMIGIDNELNHNSMMVNVIHDELLTEVNVNIACDVAKFINDKMIEAGEKFLKKVPVFVETKIRDCWWTNDGVNDDYKGQQLWLMPPKYLERSNSG